MYATEKPLYPFGYGLSYTTFSYSNLTVSTRTLHKDETLNVSVTIKNTGTRDGEEVVQLYVSFPNSKVTRPIKQLKGFRRTMIAQGENQVLTFELKPEDLAYWDDAGNEFVVESGRVNIMTGASSADIKHSTMIHVK